jgi:hypothetical protein
LFDEAALHGERVCVRDQAEAADFEGTGRHEVGPYTWAGSQFSIARLMWDMNSSATAPSITR